MEKVLADSPIWLFTNSSSVASTHSNLLAYISMNKLPILDLETGHVLQILDIKQGKPIAVDLSANGIVVGTSTGSMQVYGVEDFMFQYSVQHKSQIATVKWWNEKVICALKDNKLMVYLLTEVVSVYEFPSISNLSVCPSHFLIASQKQTFILSESSRVELNTKGIAMDIKIIENSLFVAIFDGIKLTVYRDFQVLYEHTPKTHKSKMKNPVHSVLIIDSHRTLLSLITGQIVLISSESNYQIPNNPHSKAIMALLRTPSGFASIGMDRIISNWKSTENSTEQPTPRAINIPSMYAEPVWKISCIEGSCHSVALNEDIAYVTSKTKSIIAWNYQDKLNMSTSRTVKIPSEIEQIASIDHCLIAILTKQNTLHVLNIYEDNIVHSIDHLLVHNFSLKKPNTIVLYTKDRNVYRWDFNKGELLSLFSVDFELTSITVNDFVWIGTTEGNVVQYSFAGDCLYADTTHSKQINCIVGSSWVVSGSEDGKIVAHLYRKNEGSVIGKHYRPVLCLCLSKDETMLVSGSMDHTVQLWNLKDKKNAGIYNYSLHLGAIRFVSFVQDSYIMSGGDDQTLKVFLVKESSCKLPPKLPGQKKDSLVKSLFPHLHYFVYQQTKEQALNSIRNLLQNTRTSEFLLFSLDQEKARELVQEAKNLYGKIEYTFWLKSSEKFELARTEDQEIVHLEEEWTDLAPLIGETQWRHECLRKAQHFLLKRRIHRAAINYLAALEIKQAVEVYCKHKMFIEAAIVSALHSLDFERVFRMWAKRLVNTGKPEQACKCYFACRDFSSIRSALINVQSTPLKEEILNSLLLN